MRESLHVLHPPGSHLDLGMRQRGDLSFKPLWRRREVDETMRRLVQKRVDGNVLGCWTILSKESRKIWTLCVPCGWITSLNRNDWI